MLKFFPQRRIQPELLEHAPPELALENLADLVRINRRFGGHSTIRKTLDLVARRDEGFTLLDIGAASGDSAQMIQKYYTAASVTSLDCNPVNISTAAQPKLIADAFALPFRPRSFDFVLASLFLHHFSDNQVIQLLASFYAIARRALLICDLERHIVPYLFFPVTQPVFRWGKISMHDGLISIRAAFKSSELLRLSANAGIKNAEVHVHRPAFRVALIARK
jgi:2-polyprenyl-3-methyl-5-hydroxy-6-metoxy-1,4-benzoquinol methylase